MMGRRVWTRLAATRFAVRLCSTPTFSKAFRKPEWWQVVVGIGGVSATVAGVAATIKQSPEYIIRQSANNILTPFEPSETTTKLVARAQQSDVARRLSDSDRRTTVIAGQFQAGKTTLVNTALKGQMGVVKIMVDKPGWEMKLFKSVGVNDEGMFLEAMKKAGKRLGKPPLLYLDVPRYSTASMADVSNFCKDLVTDGGKARIVVVASQLSAGLGFDAGGPERQYNIWIPPMTDQEALDLLTKNFPQLEQVDVERVVAEAGTVPGIVLGIGNDMVEKGMTVDAALQHRRLKCTGEVDRFLAIKIPNNDGELQAVGQQIGKALLTGNVNNKWWDQQDIPVKVIAERIKLRDAFAVSYDIVNMRWHFASPMHKKIAQDALLRVPDAQEVRAGGMSGAQ